MTQKRSSQPSAVAVMSLVLINVIMALALPHQNPRNDDGDEVTTKSDRRTRELKPSVLTPSEAVSSVVDCPTGHYYSEGDMVCKACSQCPINQIIRRPCSARADTLCGPFFEFDKFHQTPVKEAQGSERNDLAGNGAKGPYHRPTSGSNSETPGETAADSRSSVSVNQAGQRQWRTLSFALITVLSVICCLIVIGGLYVCIICRRSQNEKHIIRESELLGPNDRRSMDPEPRYVETYVTPRDRFRSSRHLPVYQQIFTGGDVLELFPPLTAMAGDVKTDVVVTQVDEGERHCVYINTAAVDVRDS